MRGQRRRPEWPHVVFGLRHFVPQPYIRNVRTLLRRAVGTDAEAPELEFIDLLFDNLCCLYIKSMRHAHRDAGIAALLGCRHLDAL